MIVDGIAATLDQDLGLGDTVQALFPALVSSLRRLPRAHSQRTK